MKDWSEYKDLCQTIDDFNELMPLLELMTNEAMLPRHWKHIEALTGLTLDDETQQFTVGNVLQRSLLNDKDKVEVSVEKFFHEVHETHTAFLRPL